jgi:hypothetical protein
LLIFSQLQTDVCATRRAGAPTRQGDFPKGVATELGMSGISWASFTHHWEADLMSRDVFREDGVAQTSSGSL